MEKPLKEIIKQFLDLHSKMLDKTFTKKVEKFHFAGKYEGTNSIVRYSQDVKFFSIRLMETSFIRGEINKLGTFYQKSFPSRVKSFLKKYYFDCATESDNARAKILESPLHNSYETFDLAYYYRLRNFRAKYVFTLKCKIEKIIKDFEKQNDKSSTTKNSSS